MSDLPKGMYRHYKGKLYEVLEVGHDHEGVEEEVVYRSLYHHEKFGDRAVWIRPKKQFMEMVTVNGTVMPRFKYLGAKPKQRLIGKLLAVAYFDLLLLFTSAILLLGIFIVTRDFKDPGFFFAVHPILGWFVTMLFGACALGIGYARFVGPWKLAVRKFTVPTPGLTKPITIAVIADLQVGDHKKDAWVEKVTDRIIKQSPDLVLIAGDLVSNELNPDDESVYLEPLRLLKDLCPTYAVLGNHDYGLGLLSGGVAIRTQDKTAEVKDRFKEMGLPLLVNQADTVMVAGQKIRVFGIDDEWGGKPDYTAINNSDTLPTILLAHNPDAILAWPESVPKPIVTVAGHTHGGQMLIPLIGPIGDAYLKLSKKFYQGVHMHQGTPVFVTTGVGESLGPIRIGVPPEIALVTLIPKK